MLTIKRKLALTVFGKPLPSKDSRRNAQFIENFGIVNCQVLIYKRLKLSM